MFIMTNVLYCLSNELINGCRGFQAQQLSAASTPCKAHKLSRTLHTPHTHFLPGNNSIYFHISFCLLCLWFLIELPGSDTSVTSYLPTLPPQPGHYLTATMPGVSWGTGGTMDTSHWSAVSGAGLWLAYDGQQRVAEQVWQAWLYQMGGRGGADLEPRGVENMEERVWQSWQGRHLPCVVTCYDTLTTWHSPCLVPSTALATDWPTDNINLIPQEIFNWIIVTKYCLLNQVVSYCNLLSSPWIWCLQSQQKYSKCQIETTETELHILLRSWLWLLYYGLNIIVMKISAIGRRWQDAGANR